MDIDPYRPPASESASPETPDLWMIEGEALFVRDGASLPDVCLMGHHTGDARHRISRDWFIMPVSTARTPLRLEKPKRIHLTTCETEYCVRRYKMGTVRFILLFQAMLLFPSLAVMVILGWLTGYLSVWPVFAGFALLVSFLPWLMWDWRFVYDAGNGWYQIGVHPETLERLSALQQESGGAESANSSA